MEQLIATIIPLDLAATLSPGILAIALLLLGSKKKPVLLTFSLLVGNLVTAGIITTLAFFVGTLSSGKNGPNPIAATLDLLLGLFFIFYGFKVLKTKDKKLKINKSPSGIVKWTVVGFLISITNFDAELLSFSATREVAISTFNVFVKASLITVNILFFVLPIILPLIFCLLFPTIGAVLLGRLNFYVLKYSRFIIFAMFIIFGVYFVWRAINHF